jgi:arginase
MRTIGLLGVPTNSAGKIDGVARGPLVLREEGLVDALHRHAKVHDYGDVTLPDPSPTRASRSHVIDPDGLDALVARVRDAVASILNHGHLPLVIGGDCPLLLGCLAASSGRDRGGLLFVDGHEDAYLPTQSSSGEAADMELAFALGMADASWSSELAALLPLVAPADVRILGARDGELLRSEGVASLRDRVALVDGVRLAADPAGSAAAACATLPRPWWFHLDLDVLSTEALPAIDYPQPGGLDWDDLAVVATTALSADPRGWDVTIYNPDLDPTRVHARRIVRFLGSVIEQASDLEAS